MPLLQAHNLFKTYRLGRVPVPVLRGVSLSVEKGEFLAVLGASGSGKSTLLHLLGGLDTPDAEPRGRIEFDGKDIAAGNLDGYRATSVGFVFQFYHLLPELTVLGNVLLAPMIARGPLGYLGSKAVAKAKATEVLAAVGLAHRLTHRPAELSGGERQRVAIARALMNDPPLLLADEPTGNLDRATGEKIMDELLAIRRARGLTMVVVTHDAEIAAKADRQIRLTDGRM
ncbi:MAG: lipoprotein-releasing system ATP-binding protein LolD [Phycisphaerae bacterium]|nr:MAG: lipoprotein-releasing system ATP-binding protein LolD [Phycisphaerae bacterium]